MFACVFLSPEPVSGSAGPGDDAVAREQALGRLARTFSPRIEVTGPGLVLLDVSGLDRLFGPPRSIGEELQGALRLAGLSGHVAMAGSRTAAVLVALGRAGLTIVPCGTEAATLKPLAVGTLEAFFKYTSDREWGCPRTVDWPGLLATLRRWGLKTLGEVAALPAAEVFERLGAAGSVLQRLARGDDARPLVPSAEALPFEASLDLEWPVEQLEPLSFVLGRLLDPLCVRLEREGLAASVLHVRLRLVTRDWHVRTVELPAPIRDPRVLRTVVLLDLESRPPGHAEAADDQSGQSSGSRSFTGIDRIAVALDPAPGRIVQFSLLERALPSTEQLSTLLARLGALMGHGRCGAPALADSHRPGAFEMAPFGPPGHREPARRGSHAMVTRPAACRHGGHPGRCANGGDGLPGFGRAAGASGDAACRMPHVAFQVSPGPLTVLRRLRLPVAVRVTLQRGRPVRVALESGAFGEGRVEACAGPWRMSGQWWGRGMRMGEEGRRNPSRLTGAWNRDEWDVALGDGAVYRIFRDRERDQWFIDGIVD